jgi:RNase P/RNase MRP subunit p29
MKKLPVVAGVATALVGLSVPVVLMMTDSADALSGRIADDDTERTIACGRAQVELSVDKEAGGFEVDGDVDNAKPGSTWKVVLRHDGTQVLARTLKADAEGDLDVDTLRPNTAGSDVFTFRVKNLDTDAKACKVTVTR